jgi:hypothetical protein
MSITDYLVQIIFGWPAIILSLAASVAGVAWKRPWLCVLGAALFAPFSYYLAGAMAGNWLMLALPLFQLAAAYAVHKDNMRYAWLLLLPSLLISAWVAGLVLFYQSR